MTYAPLAGPKTAKRQIQIRQYVTEQNKLSQRHSDPFALESENAASPNLNPRVAKLSFKTTYTPETEEARVDEILSWKINLDEADRFIAALKIPSKRSSLAKGSPEKGYKPKVFSLFDLSTFRAESERLKKLRLAEAEDPEEDDDDFF
jgi:hypothetical protein